MPNGLVPQAPVHTDSLTIYETKLRIIPTAEGDGTEIRRPVVTAEAVVEQRVTHFLMGLALLGTMTQPLLVVIHAMPAAVFAGVFFVVGVSQLLASSAILCLKSSLILDLSGALSSQTVSSKGSFTSRQRRDSSNGTSRCFRSEIERFGFISRSSSPLLAHASLSRRPSLPLDSP